MQVTKQASFPAAKGVVGHGHRQGNVDAHHANQNVVGEVTRCLAIAGEDAGAVAVFVGVDQVHRLLQRLHAHHAEHGAENFFLVGHHAGLDVVKQAGAQKVAFFVAGNLDAAPVHHQRCAFAHALVDIAFDLLEMRLGHQRAHVHAGLRAGANFHFCDLGFEAGDHCICRRVAHRHHQRNCHAALATGTVGRAHQRVDRVGDISVRHDHSVVLGATQSLHPLAVRTAGGVDVFGNRRGAHEAHGFDARVGEQRVNRFFVTVDHVEHAGWQARFEREFGNAQCAARVTLGGLQDEAVTAGYCHRPHPQRHHGRKVKRGDTSGHAQGLELAPRINRRAHVFAVLALEQLGRVAGVLDVFYSALQFT